MTKTYNQHNSRVSAEYGVRDYGPTDKQSSRSGFRVAAAVISLLAVFALFLCAPAGAALSAAVQGDALPDTLFEGEKVSYQLVITGIPSQAKTLELSTDLQRGGEKSLWTISTAGVSTKDSLNDRLIHLTAESSFPSSVIIEVNSGVPVITTQKTVDGVTITSIPNDKNYYYYHLKAFDSQNQPLEMPVSDTLKILVKDEENFKERADAISNEQFKTLIVEMYDKGLTEEAKDLLDWYESQPAPMPVFVPVIVGIAALIIGLVVGLLIGKKIFETIDEPL